MECRRATKLVAVILAGVFSDGFFAQSFAEEEKVLNVYNWSDYIGENTIAEFEKEYGIQVNYDNFDNNEALNAKMLAGNSGYDVVFPAAVYFDVEIKAGVYLPLDKKKLTNIANLNEGIVKHLSIYDPSNEHAIPYMYYTTGFTYNVDLIESRLPNAPVETLELLFNPKIVSKFSDCGVSFFDSPVDVFQLALIYLHKDPNSESESDLKAAAEVLKSVRPYITKFDSSSYLNSLPTGEQCVAMSWSGDYATASARAKEAGTKINLAYTVPAEGSILTFDAMMIPRDAPHPDNAHLFLNYMMRPEVIAACTNFTNYANANHAANSLVIPEIFQNPAVYPDAETMRRMHVATTKSPGYLRMISSYWVSIKSGQ